MIKKNLLLDRGIKLSQ